MTVDTVELRALINRMERLLGPLTPTQRAAMDAYGNPGYVAPGELIESAWGNAVADHVVRVFPDVAARDTWTAAPDGALAVTDDTGLLWLRRAGAWIRLAPDQRSAALAPIDAIDATITIAATLDYGTVDYNRVFVSHLIASAQAVNGTLSGRIVLMVNGVQNRWAQSIPLAAAESETLTVASSYQIAANTPALIQAGVQLVLGAGAFRVNGDPINSSLDCVVHAA